MLEGQDMIKKRYNKLLIYKLTKTFIVTDATEKVQVHDNAKEGRSQRSQVSKFFPCYLNEN